MIHPHHCVSVYWVVSAIAMLTMFFIGFTSSPTRTPPSPKTDRGGDDGGHDEGFYDDSAGNGVDANIGNKHRLGLRLKISLVVV